MKNLCRQVYDKFPDFELEKTRKDFIRSTAREVVQKLAFYLRLISLDFQLTS